MTNVQYRPGYSREIANIIVPVLQMCFPNKNRNFLRNDVINKNYDVFWIQEGNGARGIVQAVLMAKVDLNGDVYITHVCKRSTYNRRRTFQALFSKAKEVYGEHRRYHLKVRENNPTAKKAYERAGFSIRRNIPITRTTNRQNYIVTMNTTQENALRSLIRNITVGTQFNAFRAPLNAATTNQQLQFNVRNELKEITRQRWLLHKTKWNNPAGNEPWMQLIFGNLAVSFFVVVNQYLDSISPLSVLPNSDTPYQMNLRVTGNLRNGGTNYHGANGSYSGDLFRDEIYNKTFTQLKNYARRVFNQIYEFMLRRENPPANGASPKDYLLYINRNFTGRGNGTNIMRFYTHNLGMYQFLAMFGYYPQQRLLYPFSGNCTIIAIIRISLFERLTEGRFRNYISFVAQSKNVNGQQQICHYGLRTRNMTPEERRSGGNMQTTTGYNYLMTMSNISSYAKMYDVLSANSVFRAKQRATRNGHLPSRLQVLEAFSQLIQGEMNAESRQLHNHVIAGRVNRRPLSYTPGLNTEQGVSSRPVRLRARRPARVHA